MRTAEIHGRVRSTSPADVFDTIADFERYVEYGKSIRSVEVQDAADGRVISKWDVDFRGGSMQWTEADTIDRERLRIDFEQLEGNLRHFTGYWQVTSDDGDAVIHFFGEFELGMPTLASFIEPIAESAIRENLIAVLTGVFGEQFDAEPATPAAG
jgi:ribosome-associated toxin RatA of RatAB toxin-antitoxin module